VDAQVLTDEQYERLRSESERTGLGLAELVRRAVDRSYGSTLHDAIVEGLDASFAACSAARIPRHAASSPAPLAPRWTASP
jgi:hypothetical protein